ncbi:Septin-1, partial [Ophiophagus hannah]
MIGDSLGSGELRHQGTHTADIPAVSHRFSKRPIMDKDYVGFATLPTQVHRKTVKKGFDFTLMVAARIPQTLEIVKHAVDIEEQGVKVKLTFEQYFRDESGLDRKNIQDGRVHCCLYVLSPFGHGLRPLDIEFLRAIHDKVSILPVIGKADCLTPKEVQHKKEKRSIPFAVVGSSHVVRELKGKGFRGREYAWGTVEVENAAHCDFLKLRNMLIQTHMQDLKDVTHEVHYENYRAQYIQSLTRSGARDRSSRAKLSRQSATDLPVLPMFETEKLIREKDEELRRMQEMLRKMQEQMLQNKGEQCDSL